jgi:hypothetical protein
LGEQLHGSSLDDNVERTRAHTWIHEITGHERQSPAALGGMIGASVHGRTQFRVDWIGTSERHRVVIADDESRDAMHWMFRTPQHSSEYFRWHG